MHNKELQSASEMKNDLSHWLDMSLCQSSPYYICFCCCHLLRIIVFFLFSSIADYLFWFLCNAFRHALSLPGIVMKFRLDPCKLKKNSVDQIWSLYWFAFLFFFYFLFSPSFIFLRIGFSKEKYKYLLYAEVYIAFAWQALWTTWTLWHCELYEHWWQW